MTEQPDNNLPDSGKSVGEFILYTTEDGRSRVECRFEDETIWLSQALMGELFDRSKKTISEHLTNLFTEGELAPDSVVRNFRTTAADGKTYDTLHYNLEAILAVGFRVKSPRGTQFRKWANTRLQEYLVKGFTMDDDRLKNPPVEGSGIPDYFDELLERIRDIRSSERRVYLRVREIFALAADYTPSTKETNVFFKTIQNKLHFASTGLTAAEIILGRADASQPNMGLTTWKNAPDGRINKSDVATAKNYLSEEEINGLNRIVTMWLDYAEDQAKRRKQVFLKNWLEKLDGFLEFNERNVLQSPGKRSHTQAKNHAEAQYEIYAEQRRRLLEAEAERASIKALENREKGGSK
ncbi:Uncharacterized conserved protein [Rubritalea squalenifaciens DSM 18772]|uniref:Uncharacterized conserved protein n=1 Tax=Rubritalea squalenifaciens DSM 18772 TaxID=1123071 RepID=A0A1M6GV26_9BACT|nr:virulence RhuM family protein [Rubritalea squalenifaciens]SHJ13813.1 Uncharacterized conserved protein [Rubritalea squalenifaciens DSM 18772]